MFVMYKEMQHQCCFKRDRSNVFRTLITVILTVPSKTPISFKFLEGGGGVVIVSEKKAESAII